MKWMLGFVGAMVLASSSPLLAADAMPVGVIGVKIMVKDYPKAMDFYSKLGMKIGTKYNKTEQEILSSNGEGPRLILVLAEDPARATGGGSLMVHLTDVVATAKALREAGYPNIGEPKATARSVGLTIKDPDGNTVEMLSPPPAK